MKEIAIFILLVLIGISLFLEMESQNPCSAWAKHPELCNSDHYGE